MMDEQIKQLTEYAERLAELVGGDILSVKMDYYGMMDIFTRRKPAGITEYTKEKTADNDPVYTYYCEAQIADNCKVSWFEHEEDNHETV
jgi:hypothetical protein